MTNLEGYLDSLITIKSVKDYSDDDALEIIGNIIDLSLDFQKNYGIEISFELADEILQRELSIENKALIHYFLANAWSNRNRLQRTNHEDTWEWEQVEFEKEIINIRLAIKHSSHINFKEETAINSIRLCQMWTNYGNIIDTVGRVAEGIEYRDKALKIDPSFAMALGRKGQNLLKYYLYLYDDEHRNIFVHQAYHMLKKAVDGSLHIDAKNSFIRNIKKIEKSYSHEYLSKIIDLNSFSLGESKAEEKYRRWCLNNRLFLNPLNDLGTYPIGANDILTAPPIVTAIDEGPYYYGFFNQMKQEFVSARFLYYEGINTSEPHFSDKDVLLYNTLDYPSYGLSIEKVKTAYRITYSLFDKIAFFLNKYLDLKMPETKVSFRTLWYEKGDCKRPLRQIFHNMENLPMRGLFWLSKDFFETNNEFRESIEPDAKELNYIRNHLEHKYLKLHLDYWSKPDENEPFSKGNTDTLAYSLYLSEFEEKALKLLKLGRSALIYLTLAIQCEEKKKHRFLHSDKYIMPVYLDTFEDSWKY